MMQFRLFWVFTAFFAFSVSYGQKVGTIFLPPHGANTPAWFEVFYTQDNLTALNVHKLDEECEQYEKSLRKKEVRISQEEVLTGEENEDVYVLYYKRWRKSMQAYTLENGSIALPDTAPHLPANPQRWGGTPFHDVPSPNAANSSWSLLGPKTMYWKFSDNAAQPPCPWQVNVYACAMAPSNHDILFAAPETGGIFKTTDKGINWTLALDQSGPNNSVVSTYSGDPFFALAIHPTNPDIIYAGRNNFICTSTDGGSTWLSSSPACGEVNGLAIHPSTPSTIYAACSNGLFKSTNSGANWVVVSGMTTTCYDVFFKTDDANTIFVLKKVGSVVEFWRSTDGGASFASSSVGWTGKGTVSTSSGRMTVTPANPNRIYAVILSDDAASTQPYIFKTSDAGVTWDTVCTGNNSGLTGNTTLPLGMSNGQGFYDLDIIANPNNAEEVIVATTTAYKSTNGGVSFSRLGGYGGAFSIHPDIQEMIALGGDTWIATDGGMNYSSDFFTSTSNFSTRTSGIFGTDYWGFTQGWNEDLTSGGRYHNGNDVMYETYPSGAGIRLGGGEAATGYYMMGKKRQVAFSDITSVAVPATFNGVTTAFSFTKFPNEDLWRTGASEVEFLPYCFNHIFVGNSNELWKSTDGGTTWVSVFNFGASVRQIEIARTNPDVMYVATASALMKTMNAGATWISLTLPAGVTLSNLQLALSFENENILWIAGASQPSNKRVYKTIDGGVSWVNLTTATINALPYYNIVAQAGTDGGVYILGKTGKVFYRNNTMPDWVPFSSQLPKGYLPLKTYPFYRDSKLRTAGNRGVWEVDFYEESLPIAQPTVDKLTSLCPRDTFYFDDYSALKHTGATWSWTFNGASYVSNPNIRNPKVVFNGMGTFDFSLTITTPLGTSTKAINGKIQIVGNECLTDTVPGKMLTLTAAGDYAEQSLPLNITTNNFTVMGWIKPNGIQTTNAGIFFSGSSGACGLNFKASNQLGYHWNDNSGTYNWSGGPTVTANEWSHVALVIKDGLGTSDTAFVYLNGIAYFRVGTHNPANLSSVFQFGIDRGNTSRNFVGEMEEVCFYNRALSRNEIRTLMHLTKNNPNSGSMPNTDNSLIAYYQFNEVLANSIYDKVSNKHVKLIGNAHKLLASSAPVGGGCFQRMSVTTGGVKPFPIPGLTLTFPSSGTFPNGDLVVTRLNIPSDQPCGSNVLPNPQGYWVVRNFGTNATFSALTAMQFSKVSGTAQNLVITPALVQLYKRNSNDFGNTWNTAIADATSVSQSNGQGAVTFTSGLNVTSFSQFSMSATALPLALDLQSFIAFLTPEKQGKLVWRVENEANVSGYEIQYSKEGNNFEALAFVNANGSGEYVFIHEKPAHINHYRLKIMDMDGNFAYSEVQLLQLKEEIEIQLSPNPSEDGWFQLTINTQELTNANCSFFNEAGQFIHSFLLIGLAPQNKYYFHLPAPSGVYFMKVQLENGHTWRQKLMIE